VAVPLAESLGQIQLNVTALTQLSRLFLGSMVERHSGRILNVASTAAFQPGPLMAVYYATKAYVLSFSEALANELRSSGITVTCLCPGPTQTGFQERADLQNSRLVKLGMMSAKAVALDGYRGMLAGKPIVISGLHNWLLAEAVRFAPRKLATAVSRKVAEKT
jgi:short-subunit dehydrogenase